MNMIFIANLISIVCTIVVVVVLSVRWYTRKNATRLYITEKISGVRKIVKHVYLSPTKDGYEYKDKKYVINRDSSIIDEKNRPLLIYDVNDATPLSFDDKDTEYESKLLKVYMQTDAYKDILGKGLADNIQLILLVIVIFAIVGLAMFLVYQNQQVSQLLKELVGNVPTL